MRRRWTSIILTMAMVVPAMVVLAAAPASATVFSNPSSITLNNPDINNPVRDATPYPSTIPVSGLSGTINHVAVTLSGVTYSYSQDIDALLVGPGGQSLIVVAHLGPDSGPNIAAANSTLTLSDSGALPTRTTPWGSNSTFKPVNFGGFNEVWGPPAPPGPYGNPGPDTTIGPAGASFASVFNGTNPNGAWSLYVITTSAGDGTGAIAGGWSLDITTANAAATTTALSSSNNPSFTTAGGNSVTLTATVHKASDSSNVNEGTVAFTDGGVTISGCGAVAVTAGQATCNTTFTTEGNHLIQAQYAGTANFGFSSATLPQVVNNHTTVTGSSYCNTGSIALNNPSNTTANALPYPSNVFVSGLSGTLNHLAVTLNGATYGNSQDIDALLVGPGGQTFILVAAAGPNSSGSISNVTLTLDDSALSTLAQNAPWGAPNSTVTSKPVNYGGVNEAWGPPAPPGPYANPGPAGGGTATLASVFNGTNGNGTWSLYVITTAAGDGTGAIAGGWCANVTAVAAAGSTTTVVSDNNPSFTSPPGNGVTFTATVHKASDNSNVSEGTVAFTQNGTTISGCASVAVSAGTTTCATIFSSEGNHLILAQYSGTTNFGPSNASLTQVVNNHTTVTANNFCNTGSIALNNPSNTTANATPYPSNIFVSGRPGPLQHLTVTLNNTTYGSSQDIDALLVGPNGQTFILVAAAGPNSSGSISNVTLTLDDSALSTLAQNAPWGAPSSTVISKPVNYGGLNEAWGPPAPPGPYGNPGPAGGGSATLGSVYDGASPNGTWSLYVITSAAGDGTGAIAGGWCLGVTSPSPPTLTKSFGAPSVPLNGSTTLTFTVTNPNASVPLTGIGFSDNLPAGLVVSTPDGLTGSCGGGTITPHAGPGLLTLANATLAGGATCTFSVNVTGTSAGSKVNTTSAVSSVEGGSAAPASATLVVVAPPTMTKAFGAPSVQVGGSTSLTFSITNPNGTSLSGIGFTDNLPAGLVVSNPNGLTGSCGGGTITAVAGTGSVSLSAATVPPNGGCTFSVNVTGTSAGAKVNTTGAVTSAEGGNGAGATATVTVASGPPQITKAFAAASIPLNGSTTLSFTVVNPVANGTSTGIGFTDSLPSGLVVSSPNGLTGTCGSGAIGATASGTTVSLSGATLTGGATCTFSVSVTATSPGTKNNSVTVSSTNGGTGNTSNASLTVVAPPKLTKQFGASSIPLNGTTALIFSVENPNSSSLLTGVGFTDTLPAGLVVATPNGLTGSCDGATVTATAGSNSVSLAGASFGPLPGPTSTCTFAVNVTGITPGVKVNITSNVSSNEGGSGAAASATLNVVAPPQITKSFSPNSVALNGTTTLTFTINNFNATTPLTGVGFSDSLPPGVVVSTPNALTGSCGGGTITATAGSGNVTLAGASLAPSASCTFSVNVTVTTSGVKTNLVTVTSTNGGTGNTSTATVSAASPPTITKSFAATSIPLNGTTTVSFTVTNPNGTQTLSGVGFTDNLPAGLVVSSPNSVAGSCGGGIITATPGSSSVSLANAILAAGAGCTFSVNLTGTSAGVKNNSVTVTSNEGGMGNTANASLIVVAPPVVTKAFGASSVPLNGSTTLTFTLSNPNSTSSLTGVGFTDTLPAGLVVSSPNGVIGSCGGGTIAATAGGTTVSLSAATLAAGASCTFSVSVTATTPGSKTNTTSVVSSFEGGNGVAATATLLVLAPPQISKAFGAAAIAVNGTTTLSFTISNFNTAASLTGVGFTDTLPGGLVVATPNGLTGSCGGGTITATANSSTVSLSGATIASSASCTFAVNVTGTTSGIKSNSVTVTSTNGGTGNTATATVSVALPPQISKAFGAPTIPVNGSTTMTFTITNPMANGTFTLTGVGFTDTLPVGLVVATPNGLTGSCGGGTIGATAGSGTVSLTGATLAGGASCSFSVNVTGTTAGVENNSVTVTSGNAGSGNTASASITVLAPPTIAKSFGVASLPFGGTTNLAFNLTNPNATVALTGVGFTDTLPAGLVVATPNGLTGTCGGGTITATAGSNGVSLSNATLPGGGSCTFSLNVTATSVGVKNNTTSAVTSGNGGTGLAASASLTVTRAPTTTTVTATPSNPSLGSPVTFTATVEPSGPNNSGVNPTGTVSFFLDGQATPVAVVPLNANGMASFTTSGLGAGNHTVTASYSGDTNFLPSSSTTQAMVTVTCTTTITGNVSGTLVLGPGSTCVLGGTITGSVIVPKGALLDLEGSTVTGSINATKAAFIRICASSASSVSITGSTGFVLVGDAGDDGCAPNRISGALTLTNNTGGVEAIGNHVGGAITVSGNSGPGPFPEDTAPDITGNGP